MPSRLNPYISFPGTARDEMEFYKSVFGGSLTLSTFGELGGEDDRPPAHRRSARRYLACQRRSRCPSRFASSARTFPLRRARR